MAAIMWLVLGLFVALMHAGVTSSKCPDRLRSWADYGGVMLAGPAVAIVAAMEGGACAAIRPKAG